MDELNEFDAWVNAQDDLGAVVKRVRDLAADMGFIRQSYHFAPAFEAPNSPRAFIYTEGYSPEWLKQYEDPAFRAKDPIPAYTLAKGSMTYWADALKACKTHPGVREFAQAMQKAGLIYGFGVPLFGNRNRNAYASYDPGRPRQDGDDAVNLRIRTICQMAHQRVCYLYENSLKHPVLSEREGEVLHWMAQGKSNTDIGAILGISPETVRTYAQRIYLKLEANDRTSATVKALKLGLIQETGR